MSKPEHREKAVTNVLATYSVIAIGGAIGACLRFAIGEWMLHLFGRAFPFGTLLVNILGSFVIGLLYGLLITEQIAPNPWRIFIGIGVLGAFTTFSTFSMDTVLLLQQGEWQKAMANVVLNLVLCLTLAWLGLKLGSMK